MAEDIIVRECAVSGIRTTTGDLFNAKAVIATPGTFLNGLMHIGLEHSPGGRIGEKNSVGLANALKKLGFVTGRLKTGTCARLDAETIDFRRLAIQDGDKDITPFSFRTRKIKNRQLPCYVTYTNPATHEIIRSSLDRSPLFTGIIKGTGVRYCPSIEDKVHRFPDRDRHHIFLEPESLDKTEYYPNGISTSLPLDVQEKIIHSIEGLEKARITRPGYGIEYDYVDPTQLYPTMETKGVAGLYLAGQINGTTGYEEAASLGLVAGINAGLKIKGRSPLILGRSQAYIGVLIDDLVTKGTNEPYRMFTSRVEHRLILREGNADSRLEAIGWDIGLVNERQHKKTLLKRRHISEEIERLKELHHDKALRRPGTTYADIAASETSKRLTCEEIKEVEIEIKYEGFIKRQLADVKNLKKIEKINIPRGIDYGKIHGLSSEIREKLSRINPLNLGQASRISGVTPAAISILMIFLEKERRRRETV
jgi:tRNA uridine 5-carboxymethylaminomethyl modification enzyme